MACFTRPVYTAVFLLMIYSGAAISQTLVNPDISVIGDMRTNFRTTETAEALGKKEQRRTVDPRQGTPLATSWRSTPYARQTGMAGAMDFDAQSARVRR